MAKFCGKCGARLDEQTGLCPHCDADKIKAVRKQLEEAATPNKKNGEMPQERPLSRKERRKQKKLDRKESKKARKKAKWTSMTFGQKVRKTLLKLILWVLLLCIIAIGIMGSLVYLKWVQIPIIADVMEHIGIISENTYSYQLTLHNFKGDCYEILLTNEKSVLFTVEVSSKVGDDVIFVETVEGETLGYMNDSGTSGDAQANDGIYSCNVNLSSDLAGSVAYRATYFKTTSNVFSIVFYTEITADEYSQFQDIYTRISACDNAQDMEKILKSEDYIEEYTLINDSVIFRTTFGMTGIYEWNCNQSIKGTGQYALPRTSGVNYAQAAENLKNLNYQPATAVFGENVVALRPFRTSQFNYDDFKYAGEVLSDFTTGEFDCIDDGNVTLDTMKSLVDYKIVLIDSHGTLSNMTNSAWDIWDTDPYLLTGEEYSAFGMWTSADWQAGRIVVCGTDIFYGKGYVAVSAKFFDRYYNDGDLDGSIFFLGTCYSMKNESIADVLIQKGAEVVFGYSDTVTTSYCNATLFETIINSMLLSGASANEAFDEAKNIYGAVDPSNSNCEDKMSGNTEYSIAVSQQSSVTSDERDIVLVLDGSGSMDGTPIKEIRKASNKFIDTVLGEHANVGLVVYDDSIDLIAPISTDKQGLNSSVSEIYAGGGTNIEIGLSCARQMLDQGTAKKKLIVLMSDGAPNEGKQGDELIAYADELKKNGILIYTIGFFENIGGSKSYEQQLMEKIANEGCHYEVANADDLVFFFEDIGDQISGQKYIYVRIACPVDVSVTYDGQTLSSAEKELNLRTDFGTLTFEDYDKAAPRKDNQIKVLRLKEMADYALKMVGTGRGMMNYTIGFMDEDGEYSDFRKFEGIRITKRTVIDTVASVSETSFLNIDEDGDGKYDLKLRAEQNGYGEEVKDFAFIYAAAGGAILLLAISLFIILKIRKNRKKKERI